MTERRTFSNARLRTLITVAALLAAGFCLIHRLVEAWPHHHLAPGQPFHTRAAPAGDFFCGPINAADEPKSTAACCAVWKAKTERHAAMLCARQAALDAPDAASTFTGRMAYDPYEPSWTCHMERRVGGDFGDGGKFVCGRDAYFASRPGGCLVYSVGSNGDFSFEADVRRRLGCEVHTFDPTGNSTRFAEQAEELGATFHPWGLSGAPGSMTNDVMQTASPLLVMGEIVARLGHAGRTIDILKVDCEGCEHAAFPRIWHDVITGAYGVGQVQVELHEPEFNRNAQFFAGAERAGFRLFHKERNQWGCDGWQCVEFSLLSERAAWDIFRHSHSC